MREAGREQSSLLVAIHAEAFANYWNVHDFNDFFSVPGTLAWMAYDGENPAGMIVLRVQFEQVDVITVAVRPAYRRQGLARALMAQSLEKAKKAGASIMFLDVEDGNAAALALYESMGFSHVSRRKLYYRQKDGSYTDALVMSLKLS